MRRWTPAEVDAVVATVVENPLLLAPLFLGDVPPGLVDLLAGIGVELLPTDAEVTYDCSCPDDGEPCKHAAAVVYALAEQLDAAPATTLTLRGVELPGCCAASPMRPPSLGPRRGPRGARRVVPPARRRPARPRSARPGPGRTVADDLDELVLGPGAAGTADALRPWYVALAQRAGGQSRA